VECRRQGWGDPACVFDEEKDLFRWTDGRFAFSREHADWALLRKRGRLKGWEWSWLVPPTVRRDASATLGLVVRVAANPAAGAGILVRLDAYLAYWHIFKHITGT
jgi:hypothetical protein